MPDNDFAPIKEVTNEDEEECNSNIIIDYEEDDNLEGDDTKFNKVGSDLSVSENSQ